MAKFRIYNRVPDEYGAHGTIYGSNALIYQDIINELKGREDHIDEVHLALYLFNNVHLYKELFRLAVKGAKIVIVSLPLTGYDKRKIKDAERVYESVLKDDSLSLLIFPHMYVWYGAEYAGGGAAYSFHVKAGIIRYKDGTARVFLTSGNLAPGDPTHSETAIFIEAEAQSPYIEPFTAFFDHLEKVSKPYKDYSEQVHGLDSNLQQVFDFTFVGGLYEINYSASQASSAFFTAPFVKIEGIGSNHYARLRIVSAIKSARERVLLCAQHIHDLSPFNGFTGDTIIKALITAKKDNPEINAKVLKQVSSAGLADKRRAAFVEAHLDYAGILQRENKLVHDKFVIADDTIIITTSNFTATQFGWGERQMEFKTGIADYDAVQKTVSSALSFFGIPSNRVKTLVMRKRKGKPEVKVVKSDIFSEVNGFIELRDKVLADKMQKYFDNLWNHKLSSVIQIPL
jgi:hypothetical protein